MTKTNLSMTRKEIHEALGLEGEQELIVAVPKKFETTDGYILTHSHTLEFNTLTDIEKRLKNLEDLGMRGLLEPVGVRYYNGFNSYNPYKLHIFSVSEVKENDE